jgi:cobalt-zinc-cadmium efflux system membrane fusion protein
MKRAIIWSLTVPAALLVLSVGLIWWARPELRASILARVNLPGLTRPPAAAPRAVPAATARPEMVADGWCLAHDRPEQGCPSCPTQPEGEPPRSCVERFPLIRLVGPDVAQKIGIATAPVLGRDHAPTISGNAELAYDEHAFAEVVPRVPGVIREVDADHGRHVKPGDMLCVIDSAEVGTAKAQYLALLPMEQLAQTTLDRTLQLTRADALPLKDELEARAALNRSRAELLNATQKLRNLGFSDEDLKRFEREKDTSSLLRVVSPIDGTVIERHAVRGEAINADHKLVQVADLRMMWAWVDVYEADIGRVKIGQPVTLTITGLEPSVFHGSVHYIETAVNPTTRTIRVIAEMDNESKQLRSNQFGLAHIVVGESSQVVLVPKDAVQDVAGVSVVFLPQPDGSYRAQRITLADAGDFEPGFFQVSWGVKPGDPVVTTGSYPLKAELIERLEAVQDERPSP